MRRLFSNLPSFGLHCIILVDVTTDSAQCIYYLSFLSLKGCLQGWEERSLKSKPKYLLCAFLTMNSLHWVTFALLQKIYTRSSYWDPSFENKTAFYWKSRLYKSMYAVPLIGDFSEIDCITHAWDTGETDWSSKRAHLGSFSFSSSSGTLMAAV